MNNGNTQEQEVPQSEVELNKDEIYQDAISTWGKEMQIIMCLEEMSELQKELIKNIRGKNNITLIAEEIADVSIMLEQMALIFNCHNTTVNYKKYKLARLKKRLSEIR